MPNEMGIQCFLEVAKTLNFTQAATNLFITQQACSKHVSALEKELGFPLFIRSTRRVILTPEGEMLNGALLRFSGEFWEIVDRARCSAEKKAYRLTFGLMAGTSPSVMAERIQDLRKDFPLLHIDWVYGEQHRLAEMILDRQLDAALLFRAGAEVYPGLRWRTLATFRPWVLVSSKLTKEFGGAPSELIASLPFGAHIQYGSTAEESYREAERFLNIFRLESSGVTMYETVEESYAGVETGACFAVCTPFSPNSFSPYLERYPISYDAELVCAWNPTTENPRLSEILGRLTRTRIDLP